MKTLEVIIGIVFIFLILSLIASVIQELLATLISMRGKMVVDGLISLLEIDTSDKKQLKRARKAIKATTSFKKLIGKYFLNLVSVMPSYLSPKQLNAILKEVMQEQTYVGGVKAYKEIANPHATSLANRYVGSSYEKSSAGAGAAERSYMKNMGAEPLESALIFKEQDEAEPFHIFNLKANIGERKLTESLEILCVDRDEAVVLAEASKNIQENFDQLMDRVSGWYKQRVQFFLLLIGLSMSIFFNADALDIYQNLTTDGDKRQEMMAIAADFVKSDQYAPLLDPSAARLDSSASATQYLEREEIRLLLDSLILSGIQNPQSPLGLGWDEPSCGLQANSGTEIWCSMKWLLSKIPGWIITTLAISLGAPFWFDTLKKFINIRFAGSQFSGTDQRKKQAKAAATESV